LALDYSIKFNNTDLKWSNPQFTDLIDEQLSRTDDNMPSVLVVDGLHGGGKTTLACHVGQYLEDKCGRSFSYENQVGKGMDLFLEKLNWVKKNGYKVVIYDEAEDFERKGAISKFNRLLNRVFSVLRATQIVVIIVLGIVKKLEKEPLEKGLVRCLINVHGRSGNYANLRVFDAGNIFYLIYLMDKFGRSGKPPMLAYGKTAPFLRSRVARADKKTEKAWDLIDLKQKGDILDTASLETKGLIDIKTVGKLSGYSISSLRVMFRSIKPEVVRIGRKNYYYKSVLARINSED